METRRGGRPFDKNALYQLLTNVAYIGKVKYKDEVHEGEHDAIVDTETFNQVQSLLLSNFPCFFNTDNAVVFTFGVN